MGSNVKKRKYYSHKPCKRKQAICRVRQIKPNQWFRKNTLILETEKKKKVGRNSVWVFPKFISLLPEDQYPPGKPGFILAEM